MSNENEKVSVVGAPNVNTDAALDIESSITEDLEKRESIADETQPQSETPAPAFDIGSLSHEQLQALKAQLAATPDRADTKHQNPTVKMRRINGKLVMDFKNAFLGLVDDEVRQAKVERHIIPVLLEGEQEFKNMLYKDLMRAEQVVFEVLDMKKREVPIVEGETYDPYGQLVERVRTDVTYVFELKTDDGRTIEVPGKIVNA